ncbi:MAG: hypothetical protein QM758_28755 [Armatimonas sp.]
MSALSLRRDLDSARQAILDAPTEAEARHWCAWAMNRLLVAAALLTEDVPFEERFPERSGDLRYARLLAHSPTAHVGKLLPFLKTFGRWVVRESERGTGESAGSLPRWRKRLGGKR